MKTLIFHAASLLIAGTLFSQSSGVWTPSQGGNGHFYELLGDSNTISWTAARDAAIARGGYLATITSAAENTFISSLGTTGHRWIGGFQPPGSPEPDGGWSWVTGETFSYSNWNIGEPNNTASVGGEDYLAILDGSLSWNDFSNTGLFVHVIQRYVVEYPTPVRTPPPHYTQGSGATWSGDPLLGSNLTIGGNGCFISAASIILNSYGHHTDPGKLNQFLSPSMSNSSGSLTLLNIKPSTTYGETDGTTGLPVVFRNEPFQLGLTREEIASTIEERIEQNGPVLLRVPQAKRGLDDFPDYVHAIVAWKVQGDQIYVRNPGSSLTGLPAGSDIDLLTLDNYVSYVNGSGIADAFRLDSDYQFLLQGKNFTYASAVTIDSPTTVRGAAHSPVEFVITDPLGRRLGFNPLLTTSYQEIPNSIYDRLPFIVSPDGELMSTDGITAPIEFELGTLINGTYALDVYGIGVGDWSINLGLSDANGFDPDQYLFSGVASTTSHEQFTFAVPEPSTGLLIGIGLLGIGISSCRKNRHLTKRCS